MFDSLITRYIAHEGIDGWIRRGFDSFSNLRADFHSFL